MTCHSLRSMMFILHLLLQILQIWMKESSFLFVSFCLRRYVEEGLLKEPVQLCRFCQGVKLKRKRKWGLTVRTVG